MNILELIERARTIPQLRVLPHVGVPLPLAHHVLPEDLIEFYNYCGGIELWFDSPYAARILGASEVRPANPVIVGQQFTDDISESWYTIACDCQRNFLTIDLNPLRLGRCYDSFPDRHAISGSCPVIANSFTDLLMRLLENRGRYWYWLDDNFVSLGDAYDV